MRIAEYTRALFYGSLLGLHSLSQAATPVISGQNATNYQAVDPGGVPARAPYWGDIKVFPGILCKPLQAQTADFIIEPVAMKNGGLATLGVMCPLVRDNAANSNGVPRVEINLSNATAGVDFHCVIYNYQKYGMLYTFRSATSSSAGDQTMTLDLWTSSPGGYYSLFCNVPSSSRIYSYLIIENAETNSEPY